ncbi:MAG TPA: phosphatidylglycerol lysyltransferase domain-containing protein, partial [Candidatus Angelobacter sp.]
MTSPAVPDPSLVRDLVLSHSWNPIAYQILNPGIKHWFSSQRDAVIGYVVCKRIRVVAGAPVCSPARMPEVINEFEAEATQARERVCYFHVGPRFASVVNHSATHSIAAIGSLPYWNPADWHLIVKKDSSLRYQIARARNKGIDVVEMPASAAADSHDLRDIRQQWLKRKHLPPLHFLIEPDLF